MTAWSLATALTALACAASGGAFLPYSTFTARALADLPPEDGLAAMQHVNRAAPRSAVFMALVFGAGVLAVVVAGRAATRWSEAGSSFIVAGAAVYLVGVVATTIFFHVPRNDRLSREGPIFATTGWSGWLRTWVIGNHVRTSSGLVGATLLLVGALETV